ncbi:MAG: universal stress protein [Candidatus Eremiobacteraeota bacterium]|nr:universal stress protein [Candidatus Eremiobacteraeota bacterium]
MFKHVLVAHDGSDFADHAAAIGEELAAKLDAKLTVCYVVDLARVASLLGFPGTAVEPAIEALEDDGQAVLERLTKNAARPATTHLLSGFPPEQILRCAREHDVDLIVMGSHGRTGIARVVMGSVAEAVMRGSHCPVLIDRLANAQRHATAEVTAAATA